MESAVTLMIVSPALLPAWEKLALNLRQWFIRDVRSMEGEREK